ncbi:MAG: single-stranded DNA-binding protein [Bacteroidetes bacterium]|nr:single-stranded DNA-binding protein [Bacteroidota bacterium]
METLKSQLLLHGNLGGDPRITTTQNGGKVANFSIACNSNYHYVNGKVRKDTVWHDAFAFGQAAEFIENYGRRGVGIVVQGTLVDRTYTNKKGEPKQMKMLQVNFVKGL